MKKLLLIASVLLATSAFADKVGVVDSQRAFFQFSETKKAQQSLEGQAKKVENETRIEDIYVKAVKKVAAEGKYDYIFEAEALKVGGEDITDRVIKEMEALK